MFIHCIIRKGNKWCDIPKDPGTDPGSEPGLIQDWLEENIIQTVVKERSAIWCYWSYANNMDKLDKKVDSRLKDVISKVKKEAKNNLLSTEYSRYLGKSPKVTKIVGKRFAAMHVEP